MNYFTFANSIGIWGDVVLITFIFVVVVIVANDDNDDDDENGNDYDIQKYETVKHLIR